MSMEEILVSPGALPWHSLGSEASYRLLRHSEETGQFAIILRLEQGATFARHYHLGAGEFLMLKGELAYKSSVARTGDYGYEPLGAIHPDTRVETETELLFIGHGPIAFTSANGGVDRILDSALLRGVANGTTEAVSFTAEGDSDRTAI